MKKLLTLTIVLIVTALVLAVSGMAQATIIEGQGVWLFDEGTDTTTADSSGNGNDGTLVNGPGWTTDTPFAYAGNHALLFDGSDDFVLVPDSASLDVTGAITVEAWLKPDTVTATPDWRAVVYKLHDTGDDKGGYGLIVEVDQSAVYFFTESGGVAFAGANLTLDAWNHVVGTLDATGYMALYVNGVLKDSGNVGAGYLPYQTDRPLYIGGNPDNDGFAPYEFDGTIDEVRILARALSAEEVLYDYEHSLAPIPEPPVYSCSGFEPPMDKPVTVKKKNRVLPLKMELVDSEGYPITDLDIVKPPVVEVDFNGGSPTILPDEEFLFAGQGDDGNQFVFTEEGKWQFNLQTKNFSGTGTYTIIAVSGDPSEYVIDPTCTATFVIQ